MVLQGLPTEFADFCVRRWRPKEARTERREASSVILPRGLADRLRAEYPWLTDEDVRRAATNASSALRSARGHGDEGAGVRPAPAPQHLDEAAQDDELVATIYQQLEELLCGWWDSFLLIVCF